MNNFWSHCISHRMVQTGLGFSLAKETKSTWKAAQKTKHVEKLLKFLGMKSRSLGDTIGSLAHLVGEPVGRGKRTKKKKHNITKSDVSDTSPCLWLDDESFFSLHLFRWSLFFFFLKDWLHRIWIKSPSVAQRQYVIVSHWTYSLHWSIRKMDRGDSAYFRQHMSRFSPLARFGNPPSHYHPSPSPSRIFLHSSSSASSTDSISHSYCRVKNLYVGWINTMTKDVSSLHALTQMKAWFTFLPWLSCWLHKTRHICFSTLPGMRKKKAEGILTDTRHPQIIHHSTR